MSSSGCAHMSMEKMRSLLDSVWQKIWEVGREDPRRAIHSLKVGLALTLVSLLYLLEPLFKGIGENAIWAVMTVALVLEYTAGATLYKGLNRGFGTLLAGLLAFLVQYVVDESGRVFCALFIGISVFIIGTSATYVRFIPYINKNYDYGVVIFLLTFNLITVSSYRVHSVLDIARERLYTIAIGCSLCLVMSLLIFPNWSGEDLHNVTVSKLEGLARSIEACVSDYFQDAETELEVTRCKSSKDVIHKCYKAVLDTKSNDEKLALFASWEPRHSRHCYRYPWQQYVKVGAVLRHFGYTAVALHGCLQSEVQAPKSVRAIFRDPCIRVAREVAKVLLELANSINKQYRCSPDILFDHLHEALQDLNAAIKSQPRLFLSSNHQHTHNMLSEAIKENTTKTGTDHLSKDTDKKALRPTLSKISSTSLEFSEALPFAAFVSLLVEMVVRLEIVIKEVEELEKMAHFKEFEEKPNVEIVVSSERTHPESTYLAFQAVE